MMREARDRMLPESDPLLCAEEFECTDPGRRCRLTLVCVDEGGYCGRERVEAKLSDRPKNVLSSSS